MESVFLVDTKSPDGSPILPDIIYTIDKRGFPTWSSRRVELGGQVVIADVRNEPFGVMILWEVPKFGKVMVTADNEGNGFVT